MSWLRLTLPAALLALLLAGCSAATSGPAVNSELGGLKQVHSSTMDHSAARDAPAAPFLSKTSASRFDP